MQLEDFVSETLKQIISGVRTAQVYAKEHGARVVPGGLSFCADEGIKAYDADHNFMQEIHFDVAVTTTEGTEAKGGLGIFVGAVGVGSQGKLEATNTSVSRIKFVIPVRLPPA